MPRVRALDILDKPTCAGGIILVRAIDCLSRRAEFTTTGEDSFTVELPITSAAAPYVTSRYIARVQFADSDTNFQEWRFVDDNAQVERRGGRIAATAFDLVNDLAAPGPIRVIDAVTGIPSFDFSIEATPTQLIDNYILQRLSAKGYTWIARGTVDSTTSRLWEWQFLNPLELLRLIASVERHEYRLRRNGTTNYLIDLVETINGSAAPVELRPGINLRHFRRTRKGANHYTVLEGFGNVAGDGRRATIARACWKVTAVNTTTKRLTLADPSGAGSGPIIEDDQWVYTGPTPGYLFRYDKGGIHRIVDSLVATQEVEVDSTGIAATYSVGDLVEIRSGAGTAGAANEVADGWDLTAVWFGKRVTAIDTGNKRLTLDDPFADSDVVPIDNRYVGWTARACWRAASSLMSANSQAADGTSRQCTVGSTTGMQAGDLVYHTQQNPSGAPNWVLQTAVAYEVVSVDSSTQVTIKHRRKSGAVPALANSTYLSAWRPRTPDRVCTGAAAAGDTIDVDDVTGIATNDLIELVRKYDAPVATELASPAGVASYGTRIGRFERDNRGEVNLFARRNAIFRDWSAGPHALPDGWYAQSNTRAFNLKNTDPVYVNPGPNSLAIRKIGQYNFAADIAAGATSATLTYQSGPKFEVGESVRLSAGGGNEETVVLTSVSGDGLTIGFAACANGHLTGEPVRSVALGAAPSWVGASLAEPGVASAPLDIPSLAGLTTYVLRMLLHPRGFGAGETVAVKLTLSRNIELGGANQTATQTLVIGTDITADTWNAVVISLTQTLAGGRLTAEVASSALGAANRTLYVGAVGLFQATYDPEAIPEFSFATELFQATNAKLALVSLGPPATYDLGLVDLYGLDPLTWPHLQLIAGVTARTTEPTAGVAGAALRILKLSIDYDRPADARAEVGTRQQRLTEILANAKVPVPIVRIKSDGTTEVLTDVGQQQLSFPTIGLTSPPPTLSFSIEE